MRGKSVPRPDRPKFPKRLDTAELAAALDKPVRTVEGLRARGALPIPGKKIGGRWSYSTVDVEKYLGEQ